MVVYNVNLGDDMYHMWNLTTTRIHNSRGIIGLKRMYYPRTGNAPLIDGPTFRDTEVQEGIGVINTTKTTNNTHNDEYAYDDKENSNK